jgi:hypothetical protein
MPQTIRGSFHFKAALNESLKGLFWPDRGLLAFEAFVFLIFLFDREF